MDERGPYGSSPRRHLPAVPDDLSGLDKFAFTARHDGPLEFLRAISRLLAAAHDGAEKGSTPMRDLIRSLGKESAEGALAILAAIETMAPEVDDRFEAGTQLARIESVHGETDLVERIRLMLHNAPAVNAGELVQDHGDTSTQLLELDIDGEPLTLLLTIDHNDNHSAKDMRVIAQTIRSFQADIADQPGPSSNIIAQGEPAVVSARFRFVLERADFTEREKPSPMWQRELRALFWWAAEISDGGELSGYEFRYCSPRIQRRLIDHFLASDIGKAACTPLNEPHLETLAHMATMRGHGHLEQWGPRRIELCLMDWFPHQYDGRAPAREFLGLFRAWIQWCSTLKINAGRDYYQVFSALDAMESIFLDVAELFDQAVERGDDLDELKRGRRRPDPWHEDTVCPWRGRPDIAAAVGRDFVKQIDVGPLVDGEFEWTGLHKDDWLTIFDVVRSVEAYCEAMLGPEYAAAAKRLIRKIAWDHPLAFGSRGTVEQNAMAIVWIICSANAMFVGAANRPAGEPRVRVKDAAAYFALSPNAHRKVAEWLLARIEIARVGTVPVGLGDPEMLVASRRDFLRKQLS